MITLIARLTRQSRALRKVALVLLVKLSLAASPGRLLGWKLFALVCHPKEGLGVL
jgi:hypothetical protein